MFAGQTANGNSWRQAVSEAVKLNAPASSRWSARQRHRNSRGPERAVSCLVSEAAPMLTTRMIAPVLDDAGAL